MHRRTFANLFPPLIKLWIGPKIEVLQLSIDPRAQARKEYVCERRFAEDAVVVSIFSVGITTMSKGPNEHKVKYVVRHR